MPYHTKQQQAVLRCLEARSEESLTVADLADALRREACAVGLATIYRQLEKLEQLGSIHKIVTDEGALYQYCPHQAAHQGCFLLRCESCGRMVHLDCAHLQGLCGHLASEHQFRVDPRRTVLTGLCAHCAAKEAAHGGQ